MDKQLKSTLKNTFTPPPAKHKERFISSISYPKAKVCEFILSQIGFIRKRVWLVFILSTSYAFFYTNIHETPYNIITAVSAILPLFVLCIITEIHKSTAYNMVETELACKYNLAKIMLIRLGILGTVSFVSLILFIIIANKSDYGTMRNTLYLCVPYLLSSYLSILTITKFYSKDTINICAVVCGVISTLSLLLNANFSYLYGAEFVYIWIIVFIVLLVLLTHSIFKFMKSQEELRWNLL